MEDIFQGCNLLKRETRDGRITIFINQQTEILLNIGQIKADYPALLNNDQVNSAINEHLGKISGLAKTAANMAAALVPDAMIEKMGLDLLWREKNSVRLTNLIKSALSTHGIKLELSEIQLMQQDKDVPENAVESSQPFALTEKMKNDIICGITYRAALLPQSRGKGGRNDVQCGENVHLYSWIRYWRIHA